MWYVAIDGNKIGPMAKDVLVTRLESGEYPVDTASVWTEGQGEWAPANSLNIKAVVPRTTPKETKAPDKKQTSSAVHERRATFAVGCLVLIGVMGWCVSSVSDNSSTSNSQPTATPGQDKATMATVQCRNYMRATLRSPSTADFPGMFSGSVSSALGNNRYLLREYVDAQNAYGATIRSNYECRIRYKGGESAAQSNWDLEQLVVDGKQVK